VSEPLGGIRLGEAAKDVLRKHGGGPLHYLAILKELSGQVKGRDPADTLLAALGRDKGIEALGGRTGMYRLVNKATGSSAYDKAQSIVTLYAYDRWMPAAAGLELAQAVIAEAKKP